MKASLASPDHIHLIKELLRCCDLPTEDITSAHLDHYWILMDGDQLVGVVGLEILGRTALLRSLAVHPDHRSNGYASGLVDQIEVYARSQEIETLFLLTTTAENFFEARGYTPVVRASVPSAVAATTEFRILCPASAVCLSKKLSIN